MGSTVTSVGRPVCGMTGRPCRVLCKVRCRAVRDGRVAELTPRLRRRIAHDFPPGSADRIFGYLGTLADSAYGGQGRERVRAAVVLASRGHWDRFKSMLRLLRLDWRDVLMARGLGQDDWRAVLDAELGPPEDSATT